VVWGINEFSVCSVAQMFWVQKLHGKSIVNTLLLLNLLQRAA
jgi:hypothetical protein